MGPVLQNLRAFVSPLMIILDDQLRTSESLRDVPVKLCLVDLDIPIQLLMLKTKRKALSVSFKLR
jgi:hypothetical protein